MIMSAITIGEEQYVHLTSWDARLLYSVAARDRVFASTYSADKRHPSPGSPDEIHWQITRLLHAAYVCEYGRTSSQTDWLASEAQRIGIIALKENGYAIPCRESHRFNKVLDSAADKVCAASEPGVVEPSPYNHEVRAFAVVRRDERLMFEQHCRREAEKHLQESHRQAVASIFGPRLPSSLRPPGAAEGPPVSILLASRCSEVDLRATASSNFLPAQRRRCRYTADISVGNWSTDGDSYYRFRRHRNTVSVWSPGSVSCRKSSPRAASSACSESASVAIPICASCLCMALAPASCTLIAQEIIRRMDRSDGSQRHTSQQDHRCPRKQARPNRVARADQTGGALSPATETAIGRSEHPSRFAG